ncbi:PEP-utilizing enzyme [Kribbia dieselivorans]|uniref:PEP-utilizing enzyme n=1 Tax=Kribbia dieselivorans TaxID=331526 RepID=UPI0008383590|nr:PEP-utilizing enzyme [Kribbia dieselivorans]
MSTVSESSVDVSTPFEQVGTGLNVYESPEIVEGVVKWLETPEDVIAFVEGDADVSNVVVVARGGTTTFLAMALNAGVAGVVTLQGAPESHLGIVCREYGIPCIMSVTFDKGVRSSRGEIIPADGVRVRLDASARPKGTVSVEVGAPVDDSPAPEDAAPAMSPEQMAQIQLLLEKFGGVVPHGVEGDAVMRADMTTRVLYADPDDLHRDLSVKEVNEAIKYYTWNEWDALAARATEGESGLIPRQEYEAMGIMNCWFMHPTWLRFIEDRVGMDRMIEIGGIGRREVGTKVNMLHLWALATATSFGRGIALELNLHDKNYRADTVRDAFGIVRRLYAGLWGDGPFLSSMREFKAPILESSWIDRFVADRIPLADEASRSAFQRFNGSAELLGFLLHFDNRLGLGDTGPYPLPDGGFVLVRDLFVNEPAFPWSDATQGLPYSFTIAMFFDGGTELTTQMTDLSTVFTTPANYLPFINGVAVYARDTWDSPISELRTLSIDELVELRSTIDDKAAALYSRIAAMSQREKIEAGAMVYTAGFALPIARAAGLYDEMVESHDLLTIHPAVSACYDTIISGVATEMIPRLFLTGSWGNPVPDDLTDSGSDTDEFAVLHAVRVRGFADPDAVAESSGLDRTRAEAILEQTTERGHTRKRDGRIKGYSLTPAGRARHVLLRSANVDSADVAAITAAYDDFLAPNRAFKQLTTDWQLAKDGAQQDFTGRLEQIHAQVLGIIDAVSPVAPRFASYRTRFESKLAAFRSGDTDALAKPLTGSYHDVWMELHEDLLATLGRERSEHDE